MLHLQQLLRTTETTVTKVKGEMSTLPISLSCLLLLLVVAASSIKPVLDRAKKTSDPNQWRRPQAQCQYGGRVFNNGAVFLAQDRCSRLRCNGGRLNFVDIKCFHNNMCYNIGANIRAGQNGCQLYNCRGNGKFFPVLSDPYKCKDARNMCRICPG